MHACLYEHTGYCLITPYDLNGVWMHMRHMQLLRDICANDDRGKGRYCEFL